MSEKALLLVREEIIQIIQEKYPKVSYEKALDIAADLISKIAWNDSTLMHKGIPWITNYYLKSYESVLV